MITRDYTNDTDFFAKSLCALFSFKIRFAFLKNPEERLGFAIYLENPRNFAKSACVWVSFGSNGGGDEMKFGVR